MSESRLLSEFKDSCPARFELATSWFVAMRSIQLGYGQKASNSNTGVVFKTVCAN